MGAEKAEATESLHTRASRFLSESVEELKKVSKPTRQETIQATVVALVIMITVSICLFLLDLVFGRVMEAIVS